jgi:hypothetical protein
MYLYRYRMYVTQGDTLPHFVVKEGVYDVNHVPTISLDLLEPNWDMHRQLVFVLRYVDNTDVYYLVKDKKDEDVNLEEVNIPHSRHHCDMYCIPLFEQLINRLQCRIHTRGLIYQIKCRIGDCEYIPSYQSKLLNELLILTRNDDTDRLLLQDMIKETQNNIDTEQRFRPGEDGYYEAKRDFDCIIEIDNDENAHVFVCV